MIDYAYLFSGMGVTIFYLLYKNITLSKSNFLHKELIKAVAAGEIKIVKTSTGYEAIIKKEV